MPLIVGFPLAKEPLIIGLCGRKWPMKIRHPMTLRHSVEFLKGQLYFNFLSKIEQQTDFWKKLFGQFFFRHTNGRPCINKMTWRRALCAGNSQKSSLLPLSTGNLQLTKKQFQKVGKVQTKLQIIFHKRATKYRSLLRKLTCKDKGSYESSPPCSSLFVVLSQNYKCWKMTIIPLQNMAVQISVPFFLFKKTLPFSTVNFFPEKLTVENGQYFFFDESGSTDDNFSSEKLPFSTGN